MILTRLGNKRAIAGKIQAYFPPHEIYIEPFFGAGGMFFYKPLAKYNFLNDLDSDVFNLFLVIIRQRSEFDHPFILEQARQRGLNIHVIGERQNMKNRRVEILVTNYADTQLKLF